MNNTEKNETVGIFGGSFSPPHIGHINAATEFACSEKLDRLCIVPVFQPPHKPGLGVISPEHRFNMCRLAFSGIKIAEINDCEIRRGGNSYTSDTLEYFSRPDRKLVFLCGTDMFLTLERWHEFRRIFELAKIAFICRDDETNAKLLNETADRYRHMYGAEISQIITPAIEVSSTLIRNMIATGSFDERYLTPEVIQYIRENSLYL